MNDHRITLDELARRTRDGDRSAREQLCRDLERTLHLEVRCVLRGGAARGRLTRPILDECRRVAAAERPANLPTPLIDQVVRNLCARLLDGIQGSRAACGLRETVRA